MPEYITAEYVPSGEKGHFTLTLDWMDIRLTEADAWTVYGALGNALIGRAHDKGEFDAEPIDPEETADRLPDYFGEGVGLLLEKGIVRP